MILYIDEFGYQSYGKGLMVQELKRLLTYEEYCHDIAVCAELIVGMPETTIFKSMKRLHHYVREIDVDMDGNERTIRINNKLQWV